MPAFSINLDRDLYYPGDIVSGNVTCFFETFLQIEDIEVKLRGEEHSFWSGPTNDADEKKDGGCRRKQSEFYGHSRFLANRTRLDTQGKRFEPGKYVYKYMFQLPKSIPGSYNNGNNYIRYYIKLIVKLALEDDIKFVKKFDVLAPMILTGIDQKPTKLEATTFGMVTLEVSLWKNIFRIGEQMRVDAIVRNPSMLEVNRVMVELTLDVKTMLLHPRKCFTTDHVLLGKAEAYPDDATAEEAKYCIGLCVLPVPNFTRSKLFSGSYTVKVSVVLPDCSRCVETTLPILIGQYIPSLRKPSEDYENLDEDSEMPIDVDIIDVNQMELPDIMRSLDISDEDAVPKLDEPIIPYPEQVFDPPYPPLPSTELAGASSSLLICRDIGFDVSMPLELRKPHEIESDPFPSNTVWCSPVIGISPSPHYPPRSPNHASNSPNSSHSSTPHRVHDETSSVPHSSHTHHRGHDDLNVDNSHHTHNAEHHRGHHKGSHQSRSEHHEGSSQYRQGDHHRGSHHSHNEHHGDSSHHSHSDHRGGNSHHDHGDHRRGSSHHEHGDHRGGSSHHNHSDHRGGSHHDHGDHHSGGSHYSHSDHHGGSTHHESSSSHAHDDHHVESSNHADSGGDYGDSGCGGGGDD